MKLPKRVTICEVGTRDGFQIEPDFIPTEAKIEVVNKLAGTGMPRIEDLVRLPQGGAPAQGRRDRDGGHHEAAGHALLRPRAQ